MVAQAWLSKQGGGYILKCAAEVQVTDYASPEQYVTRTDIQWTLETTADAKEDKPKDPQFVAVMEYKRKHLINGAELQAARFYPKSDKVAGFMERVPTDGGRTYFKRTSKWLMKQAQSYQKPPRNVTDVCLFDWDTMFILNFNGFNPNEKLDNKGSPQGESKPWPAGIVYQEQAKTSGEEAECTFRSLLLAFLIRALKRNSKLSNPKKLLAPVKYDQSRMLGSLNFSPIAGIS